LEIGEVDLVSSKAVIIQGINMVSSKASANIEVDMVRMQMEGGGGFHNHCYAMELECHP
jgi:hypothetical protein